MPDRIVIDFEGSEGTDVPLSVFAYGVARTLDVLMKKRQQEIIDHHDKMEQQIFAFQNYLESRGAEMRDMSEMLDLYNQHFNIHDKRSRTQ